MKIDIFLLRFFQKISDWFQAWFGINNFFLAKVFLGLTSACGLLAIFCDINLKKISLYGGVILIIIMMLFILGAFVKTLRTELACKNNPVFANNLAIEYQYHRMRDLFLSGFFTYAGLSGFHFYNHTSGELLFLLSWEGYFLNSIVYDYFVACTPKPPSKSKVKKLAESIAEMFSPAPRLSTA